MFIRLPGKNDPELLKTMRWHGRSLSLHFWEKSEGLEKKFLSWTYGYNWF